MTDPVRTSPGDWEEVSLLFHEALEEPRDQRDAFLDRRCSGRPGLRAEVASLLAAHDRAGEFIERPAVEPIGLADRASPRPRLRPGQSVGPYRIEDVIGQGGMGIVYRAEDTRLGRVVALKAVAPRFTGDPSRRERLRREARAVAALSHSGIATVFALEEIDDELYIASELVAGETLREELQRARPSLRTAIETGLEIARALAVAHARGVVHRDLKPENVMRSQAGQIKIVDFGLARLDGSASTLTAEGAPLGTLAYMAPEQIRGGPVDFRADLFAFGVLLYEFCAGVHPFASEHATSTIARVLEAPPADLTIVRPGDPDEAAGWRALAALVLVCLNKSPDARFQSTDELVAALEAARRVAGAPAAEPSPAGDPRLLRRTWWWQFHQAAASAGYLAMLLPLNYVRHSDREAFGVGLFLAGLVAALVASTLRLHLWFTLRSYPSEWNVQRRRTAIWIHAADTAFVAVQLAAAATIATERPRLAALFVSAAVAALLAFAIIEPATTRAAFRERD